MSISYHQQFRENQRKTKQNGLFSKSKATAGGKLSAQRPTAVVKQPLRSDTFTLPTKRDETNFKVPKVNQTQNGSRRQATNKPAVINSSPPAEQKRLEPMRKNGSTRSIVKQSKQTVEQQTLQRKPVRFTNIDNNTYYSPSPAYYQKSAPLTDPMPQSTVERSRRIYANNDDYVIHRQKDPSAYAYNDYQTVSNIPTTSYMTSLPPISQSTNPTAPTVVIHPKETHYSEPPTVIIHSKENIHSAPPTVIPNYPSYSPSNPFMYLPSSAGPTYPPNSTTMFLPNSTIPTYPQTSTTMFLPTTTAQTQPSVQTYFLPTQPTSTYLHQPFYYPMPFANLRSSQPFSAPVFPAPPPPPPPPPPPAPVAPTIINQSSSSSSSAPTTVHTEKRTEENNSTIFVHPNTIHSNQKNVTIQLKMLDEVCLFLLLFWCSFSILFSFFNKILFYSKSI